MHRDTHRRKQARTDKADRAHTFTLYHAVVPPLDGNTHWRQEADINQVSPSVNDHLDDTVRQDWSEHLHAINRRPQHRTGDEVNGKAQRVQQPAEQQVRFIAEAASTVCGWPRRRHNSHGDVGLGKVWETRSHTHRSRINLSANSTTSCYAAQQR